MSPKHIILPKELLCSLEKVDRSEKIPMERGPNPARRLDREVVSGGDAEPLQLPKAAAPQEMTIYGIKADLGQFAPRSCPGCSHIFCGISCG